jgi:hypothetical protein
MLRYTRLIASSGSPFMIRVPLIQTPRTRGVTRCGGSRSRRVLMMRFSGFQPPNISRTVCGGAFVVETALVQISGTSLI